MFTPAPSGAGFHIVQYAVPMLVAGHRFAPISVSISGPELARPSSVASAGTDASAVSKPKPASPRGRRSRRRTPQRRRRGSIGGARNSIGSRAASPVGVPVLVQSFVPDSLGHA